MMETYSPLDVFGIIVVVLFALWILFSVGGSCGKRENYYKDCNGHLNFCPVPTAPPPSIPCMRMYDGTCLYGERCGQCDSCGPI